MRIVFVQEKAHDQEFIYKGLEKGDSDYCENIMGTTNDFLQQISKLIQLDYNLSLFFPGLSAPINEMDGLSFWLWSISEPDLDAIKLGSVARRTDQQ